MSDRISNSNSFESIARYGNSEISHQPPAPPAQITEKPVVQEEKPPTDYVVKSGDTLSQLAERRGISLETILRENPNLTKPNQIFVGQHLNLSGGARNTTVYIVKAGDSLAEIAKKHETTIGDILRANPRQINNPNLIFPGQHIRIPVKINASRQQPQRITTQTRGTTQPTEALAIEPKIPNADNKPEIQPANRPETAMTIRASRHLKLKTNDIQLSPLVRAKMSQIADEYFKRTGKDLVITDGNRTPHDQAERIYDKILLHDENIYTNKKALAEIKAAYNEGAKRGESREQNVGRMRRVIKNQVNEGIYISKHLSGQGADVRIKLMSSTDREAFRQSVAKIGGARILNEGDHWHIEVAPNSVSQIPTVVTSNTSPQQTLPIVQTNQLQPPTVTRTGGLKLGGNEEYKDALLLAQRRTGIDAAALAAVINAEAAVDKNGKWIADSQAPKGTARGLTQFLAGTWVERVKVRGSYLNEVALQKGFIREEKGRFVVLDEKSLLALRDNPTASIVTAAEYGRGNLATLDRNGFLSKNINDDQRAKLMYYAHHEGMGGAARLLIDSRTADEQSARRVFALNGKSKLSETLKNQYGSYTEAYKHWAESEGKRIFPSQTGAKTINAYVQKYGNYEQGYRNWLFDYTNKKIRPEIYRQ